MDRDYLEYNSWFQLELPQMPSEYMSERGLYGMVREPLAVRVRAPRASRGPCHSSCSGGEATSRIRSGRSHGRRDYIAETFDDLKPELRHRILVGNAAEHLGLDLDADITETPA